VSIHLTLEDERRLPPAPRVVPPPEPGPPENPAIPEGPPPPIAVSHRRAYCAIHEVWSQQSGLGPWR
jgi:hypothetical protein